MKPINERLNQLPPAILHKFLELATDPTILSLSVGEPDFATPFHVRQAAIDSIQEGKTFYTPSRGLLSMRKEIAGVMARKYNMTYDPATEIIVTFGASEALEATFITLLNPGDEAILVSPVYVTYAPILIMAGATIVYVNTDHTTGFKLTPQALRAAITEKTKLIVLNYPNNPTGGIMTHDDYEGIADVLRETNAYIVSDEIYSELIYDAQHASIAQFDDLKDRTIVINGFSKAYAMTGWRLGYLCGNAELVNAIGKYHANSMLCPSTIAQFAGIEALKNGDEDIIHMRQEYDVRRRYVVDRLNKMGLPCAIPQGAFYAFPSIEATGMDSLTFCQKLLEEKRVAVIPGVAFGPAGDRYIRFSYSYSIKHIEEALDRIEDFMHHLSTKV